MFDNILHQAQVINQLKTDIEKGTLPPSILFSGPDYAGKGTAALELARILSCDETAIIGRWNCSCRSCMRHRNLVSPDMLLLGRRRFFEEISAASVSFLRHPKNTGSKMLFIRSIRKLLARFNSILWEDDPKLGKLKSQISIMEEDLEDLEAGSDKNEKSALHDSLAKQCESIVKKAAKLESEGLGELVPIAQIRRAAYWSRLAPLGKHKCLIIEHADNMQEGAKNSLLKILEEPPPRLSIIISSSRPLSLLPTMLSRLREYRFAKRSAEAEAEVISRIFKEKDPYSSIGSYLASFLPVNSGTLFPLGAFFAASITAEAIRELRSRQQTIPAVLVDLGKFTAPIAEEGGMGRPAENPKGALEKILGVTEGFEIPGLFTSFLQQCGELISSWLRSGKGKRDDSFAEESIVKSSIADCWRRELDRSRMENDTYNINPFLAMERLFDAVKTGII
ncbi:MAG: DNA polymerase III [Treponema sp.]|nr:DNA polymerase III [Treponema sp.]